MSNPVKVSKIVYDGRAAVRESGETDMFDWLAVQSIALDLGFMSAADWLEDHSVEYMRGVRAGFVF